MVNLIIRPFRKNELEGYFSLRFQAALRNNKALISQATSKLGLEIDSFDFSAFHIGCFDEETLIGCIRLVFPPGKNYISSRKESCRKLSSLSTSQKNHFDNSSGTLPSTSFLPIEKKAILEKYFHQLMDEGNKIAEVGRLISFSDKFSIKGIISCLSYVYAICQLNEIDYCFFNAPALHGGFYSKYFPCRPIFPELAFETGAKQQKKLMIADFKENAFSESDLIRRMISVLRGGSLEIHLKGAALNVLHK